MSLYKYISNELDQLDGFGICLGEMACTTCLVNFKCKNDYKAVERTNKMSDEELDLLQTSDNYIEDRSRLSCQVKLQRSWMKNVTEIDLPVPD